MNQAQQAVSLLPIISVMLAGAGALLSGMLLYVFTGLRQDIRDLRQDTKGDFSQGDKRFRELEAELNQVKGQVQAIAWVCTTNHGPAVRRALDDPQSDFTPERCNQGRRMGE